MKRRHKSRLHRRYGHFGMAEIKSATHKARQLMRDNPVIAAAAIGGTGAALAAGMTGEAAVLAGAAVGIAIVKVTEK